MQFALKGYKGRTVNAAFSREAFQIRGSFHIRGRMPIGDDGAPLWVGVLFEADESIQEIAIGRKQGGEIYTRNETT